MGLPKFGLVHSILIVSIMKMSNAEVAIANLPDTFHLDLLGQKLIVIEQFEKGFEDIEGGRVNTPKEAEEYLRQKWAK